MGDATTTVRKKGGRRDRHRCHDDIAIDFVAEVVGDFSDAFAGRAHDVVGAQRNSKSNVNITIPMLRTLEVFGESNDIARSLITFFVSAEFCGIGFLFNDLIVTHGDGDKRHVCDVSFFGRFQKERDHAHLGGAKFSRA